MTDTQNVTCPSCQHQFPLSQALADKLKVQERAIAAKEQRLKEQELEMEKTLLEKLKAAEKVADEKAEKKLEQQKRELWAMAQKKAEEKKTEEFGLKMKELEESNKEKDEKLRKSQQDELAMRRRTRAMEEREKEMELELSRKLDKELELQQEKLNEDLKRQVASEQVKMQEMFEKQLREKETQQEQMKKTIEELKRKSEQGSMQVQGDAQEQDLKLTLKMAFPIDQIEDVPTGIRGADLIHTVRTGFGASCGIILWESKSTKSWSKDWIKKLKDDQGEAKANISILISQALPEDIKDFGMVEGVWVCGYRYAIPLSQMVRQHLIELHKAQKSLEGQDEKMEALYTYLTGPQFRNRVEGMVSAFDSMKLDLEKEKRAMTKIWAKREKEIERIMNNTVGLHGDMQGMMGASLPTIEALELESGLGELAVAGDDSEKVDGGQLF